MAKKRNWDQIRNQKTTDNVKYRDVYEDQQLERGSIAEKQTMLGRGILCGVIALMAFWLVWAIISGFDMVNMGKGETELSGNPAQSWIFVDAHYVNKDNPDDVIMLEELYALQDEWKLNYNPNIPVVKEPVMPEDPYITYPDGKDAAGRDMPMDTLEANYESQRIQYEQDLKDYQEYCRLMYDPEYRGEDVSKYNPDTPNKVPNELGVYKYIRAHYKNRYDTSQFIEVSDYENLVGEYEKKKLTDDEANVPISPLNPSKIYRMEMAVDEVTDGEGGVSGASGSYGSNRGNFDTDGNYIGPKCPMSQEYERCCMVNFIGPYHQHRTPTGTVKGEFGGDSWFDINDNVIDITVENGEIIRNSDSSGADGESAEESDASMDQDFSNITYRNIFDGHVLTYEEYNDVCDEYTYAFEEYNTAYMTHRQTYHPDDIDGTKKVFSMKPTLSKFLISLAVASMLFGIMYAFMKKNLDAQNLLSDTSDINQYHNDQHVALPEEVQRNYDWFPDVGAHSGVSVSSMISHMALTNKGLKQVEFAKRADKDILDENGDVEYYKGEILLDDDGNPITSMKPMIDEEFMDALFDASGAPNDKNIRKKYDTTKIPYNPDGSNRDKLGKYATVADMINEDWEYPIYEPQRPGGAYIVDTAPVNTMVLAITRAGKGQTVIEPTLDMWMREKRPNNMVVNDPKGELLVKNYVRATVRGLQVVQFNLINAMKTDIYNPLAMAADAAREGDNTKCAMYVENIAEVFFPLDGGDDPVWPNAANNAFKRAAYGLIDFYLEEEKAMRRMAERTHIDDKVLEQKIDEMWGKVTLYNCYQLFVQLSSKKMKNPAVEFSNQAKAGKFNDLSDEEYEIELNKVKNKSKLWEDKPDADLLTLYFAATDALPKNSMRTLVSNANNALKSMGGAEKMMASVYGIAITAMSFFTDPTISTLTSGTLNQNVDLGSLSFPRRMGVRFNSDYIKKYHFVGLQCVWNAYEDINFEKCLGKDFYHEDMVTREGWARYFFDGKFKNETAYIKLEIKNPSSGILVRTFFFEFKKNYQTSLDGRVYMKDPVLEEKIVKNGIITELRKFKKKDGSIVYRKAKTTFKQQKILDFKKKGERTEVNTNAIISTMCRYAEKPKMVFLVTPPHLMKYAKLILILIKQLVDLNFDKSYMTKSNQKPLYKTRFMLDELGNLQSEGHGISGFETMLSIGLGQEQQFTLILQTLQQLKDVYGDSVDKIVQGNTSNIVFLKSTDDSMLDTLQKMSGTRHRTYTDSKTITRDMQSILKMTQNEGKASYTMTTKEEPVISYNDMAFISERNSIVFRAGDSPIWNRNETILPMSWRLFKTTITQPGKEYTLQTIPTLSTAMDFDVRKNQPNFSKMLEKRMEQAYLSLEAQKNYQEAYGYSDYDIEQLDPDNYADEIMDLICSTLNPQELKDAIENDSVDGAKQALSDDEYEEIFDYIYGNQTNKKDSKFTVEQDIFNEFDNIEANTEQLKATETLMAQQQDAAIKRYACKMISRDMIVSPTGINHGLDESIIRVYKDIRGRMEKDDQYFTVVNGNLCGRDGKTYIKNMTGSDNIDLLNEAAKDENSRIFAENDMDNSDAKAIGSFVVTDDFLRFLVTFPKAWPFADGEFELKMKNEMLGGETDEETEARIKRERNGQR